MTTILGQILFEIDYPEPNVVGLIDSEGKMTRGELVVDSNGTVLFSALYDREEKTDEPA